ncbi:helix-turn-helix domain-containing protein [Streptomyces sp. NBC_00138]|uniref:helix-turn-helix domain-containing protein n=1 Tax=Streptomyces sp. NBC_00138 TaxID=2903625 RepID=UPI00324FEF83
MAELADRAVPAAGLFSPEVAEVGQRVLALDDLTEMAALTDGFLLGVLPPAGTDPRVAEVAALVERITASPQLFRVDELARELDLPVRRLQRLFAQYVGASPKWVLRRARLHEAAARADEGADVDWAALSADLGYADQAHLTRDFAAAVGSPPSRYTRAQPLAGSTSLRGAAESERLGDGGKVDHNGRDTSEVWRRRKT